MATETRNDKLLKFYSECQSNGYTNMKDSTQSLKAKVIASDLGLNYSKIGSLYEEARKVSEEKNKLDSMKGTLVYSCYPSSYNYEKESPILELYTYGNNSYYCVVEGKRTNGAPSIFTETVVLPNIYTRAPSTTYYGVSYNGMTTGTVSHDPGGETMRMEKTGGANIVFKVGEDKYTVKAVKPSPQIYDAFKRDGIFIQFYNGNVLVLDNMNQVTYSGDIYASMRQIALPADEAQKAAELLRRMGSNQLPPSDQVLYDKAVALLSSKSSIEVQKAIDTFELISDFKDAPKQKEKAEKRLAEVIQSEKEAAIIKKEKGKKTLIIGVVVALVAAVFMYFVGIPNIKLNNAKKLIESGDYKAAHAILEELDRNDVYIAEIRGVSEKLIQTGKYDEAYRLLAEIGDNETIKANKYDRALDYVKAGDYVSAYELLVGLKYKDSEAELERIKPLYHQMLFDNAKVGSYVFFGTYEQDNNTGNGKEDIEWLILDKKGNQILVLSKYILDYQPFHRDAEEGVTWETCSLRSWLNNTFLKAAFSSVEQKAIQTVTVNADKHPASKSKMNDEAGNSTKDKIFLLSYSEVIDYIGYSEDELEGIPTEYTIKQGIYLDSFYRSLGYNQSAWLLRTTGDIASHNWSTLVAEVYAGGTLMSLGQPGHTMVQNKSGIRPALWINIT